MGLGAGDLIAVVAAGTTSGRLERWIGRLDLASPVLIALDADAAGDIASGWWLKALGPQARRWQPLWDDPAAMLQGGANLRTWVREGLGTGPKWWRDLACWPEDRQELWAERAAILEVEGGLSRDEAERHAFELLRDAPSPREHRDMTYPLHRNRSQGWPPEGFPCRRSDKLVVCYLCYSAKGLVHSFPAGLWKSNCYDLRSEIWGIDTRTPHCLPPLPLAACRCRAPSRPVAATMRPW